MQGCWEACQIINCQISSHDSTLAIHIFPKNPSCVSVHLHVLDLCRRWRVVNHPSSLLTVDVRQLFTHCHHLFLCPLGLVCHVFLSMLGLLSPTCLIPAKFTCLENKESNTQSGLVLIPPALHGSSLSLLVAVRHAASLYSLSFDPSSFFWAYLLALAMFCWVRWQIQSKLISLKIYPD